MRMVVLQSQCDLGGKKSKKHVKESAENTLLWSA
jgi:hypothetical protein